MALIGFELGLFFGEIGVFGRKMHKIGFVLHKLLINSYVRIRRIYIAQTRNPKHEIRNNIKIQITQIQNSLYEAKKVAPL